MEITKETNSLESFLTSYEKMTLDFVESAEELSNEEILLNTENHLTAETYYSIALPIEDTPQQTYTDFELPSESLEETSVLSSDSFLETIKQEITTFLNIQKIESETTLPFIQIHKEAETDGK